VLTPSRRQHGQNPNVVFGLVPQQLREDGGDSEDLFAHRTGYHRN